MNQSGQTTGVLRMMPTCRPLHLLPPQKIFGPMGSPAVQVSNSVPLSSWATPN